MSDRPIDGLRLAVGQLNPTVNDIDGNLALARSFLSRHRDADLCVLSECFLTGYPFEDLAFRPGFVSAARAALDGLCDTVREVGGPAFLVGLPMAGPDRPYNAAVLIHPDGSIQVAHKLDLPNIGVFDEWRHFTPGSLRKPFVLKGARLGVAVCEEMWHGPVVRHLADEGADLVVVINGSPFEVGKQEVRHAHARNRVRDARCPLIYVNQVGGQDELVFDGASFVMDAGGRVVAQAAAFAEDEFEVVVGASGVTGAGGAPRLAAYPEWAPSVWQAQVLSARDYVRKNGFAEVLVAESGGFDSAYVTAVLADALGPDAVAAFTLPGRHNGPEGVGDAYDAARMAGAGIESIAIQPIVDAFEAALAPHFEGRPRDVTEENLQARVRGVLMMSLSNKLRRLLMTTGNKSEMAVGYATLYGDMNGGFNVLKDLYKSEAKEVALWRNGLAVPASLGFLGKPGEVIPARVIAKPPSAELAEGQTDEGVLGPYPVLDELLRGIVEMDLAPAAAARRAAAILDLDPAAPVARSPDLETHARLVTRLVRLAEFKRRQAPPGTKLSGRNFGGDRRYPITNGGELQ